jgi:hypothetical protein
VIDLARLWLCSGYALAMLWLIVMFKAVGKVSINECNKNVQCTRVLKSAELRKLGPEVKARLIVCRDRSGYALDRLWQALAMLWLCSGKLWLCSGYALARLWQALADSNV